MYGQIEATQQLESRCRRLRAESMDGAGQPCLPSPVASSEGFVVGDCPAISRRRQRANDSHIGAPEAKRLDLLRHDPAGQAGIAECRPDSRDCEGPQAAQGELVCADVAQLGQARRVRRGSCVRLCPQRLSENAALTPSGGVDGLSIAPGDGVEALSPTPGDGAIRPIFYLLSTPPDGDPLDMPSACDIWAGGVR